MAAQGINSGSLTMAIDLSVIITTRNRASLLRKALFSITKQSFPSDQFEVIVVDNGSTDETVEVCEDYKPKLPGFQRVYDERPGLHVGRHLGLKHAKGEILVYADDDIEAFPTWLEGIAESFQDPEVALVGGKILPKYETEPPDWIEKLWNNNECGRMLGWYSLLDFGEEVKEISPLLVWGCNFSIRKNVLIEAGGFHPDSMPEELIKYRGDGETHVSRKFQAMGYKAIYNPKASVYHRVPTSRMTLEYLKKRNYNQGISDSFTDIRNNYNRTENNYKKTNSNSFYQRIKKKSSKEILSAIKRRLKFVIHRSIEIIPRFKQDNNDYIREEMKKAYQEGYKYHQNEVKNDPELLKWVLKDNYFES